MNVQKINAQNNITSFKSAHRVYDTRLVNSFKSFGNKYVHTTTNLFREDFDWTNLARYISYHFADKSKVNAYSLACSDGSEAYTYAISLIEEVGQNFSKYFPIKAFDIDYETIDYAKSGRINVYGGEFNVVKKLGIDLKKYFINPFLPKQYSNDEMYLYINSASYEPTKELRSCVEFNQSDILTELKKIKDDGNSVVMCRNVMPYLSPEYVDEIVQTAKENLKEGSLFITGDYDHRCDIEEKLFNNGFYRPFINNNNLFERGDAKKLINRLLMGYLI